MRFCIQTLGCKVNTYESNVMADLLINAGYQMVSFKDNYDICIINLVMFSCFLLGNRFILGVKLTSVIIYNRQNFFKTRYQ